MSELPSGASYAMKEAYHQFLDKYQAAQNAIADTILSVLVWGPGDQASNPVLYKKRCAIQDRLNGQNNVAMFSEALANLGPAGMSPAIAELAQAIAADWIVVLEVSSGALAEVAKFGADVEIATKMLVLAPESCIGGFAHEAILREPHIHVSYFTETDMERCNVIATVMGTRRG